MYGGSESRTRNLINEGSACHCELGQMTALPAVGCVLSPAPIVCWSPNPVVWWVPGGGALGVIRRIRWGPKAAGLIKGLVPLGEEEEIPELSLPVAICKPRRELSPEPDLAGALISNFQPPKLWENTFWFFKAASSWSFVAAAWADQYRHVTIVTSVHLSWEIWDTVRGNPF